MTDDTTSNPTRKWYQVELTPQKVKPEELMNFARQGASFIRAGIPVLDALDVLMTDMKNDKLRSILADVSRKLRAGTSFSAALADHHKVFPQYFVSMIRSAELTGKLDTTLDQVAEYIDRDLEARRKIKSALTYPLVICATAIVSVLVLTIWVLPKFKTFFTNLGAKLPFATRVLVGVTNFVTRYGLYVAGGVVALLLLTVLALRTERGKCRRDAIMLRLPGVGFVVRYSLIERFCRILSSLAGAGVPLPDAMTVATESTSNRVYQRALATASAAMLRGEGLAQPIAETNLFPGGVVQMLRVGESTGTLDEQLSSASDFYGRELTYRLKKLTDLVEPAVIMGVGLIVGFVAVALVSAMYGVFNQVK